MIVSTPEGQQIVEYYSKANSEFLPSPEIDAFLADIFDVCNKHKLWIGHEDCHGSFTIETYSTEDWLLGATDCR